MTEESYATLMDSDGFSSTSASQVLDFLAAGAGSLQRPECDRNGRKAGLTRRGCQRLSEFD